ncbi:MAG: hypothetical protein GOV01_01725 [Candidatus Altiarchaeota archaeon]|nr:hypothetical protein [Candidatus Altiarchaeota archaeon]
MKTPRDFLVDYLKNQEIQSIRSSERNLNRLAVALNRGWLGLSKGDYKGSISESYRGIDLLKGPGGETTHTIAKKQGEPIDLPIELEMPKIIIDYGLWSYHSEFEKFSLLKQTVLSLETIRCMLWDRNLIIASSPPEVSEFVASKKFFGTVLKNKYEGTAVLLDPSAEDAIKKFEPDCAYIIGGIVDKSNRMRTRELGYSVPRVSLKLKNKSSNVSDRINHIVEAICRNLTGETLSDSIRQSRS